MSEFLSMFMFHIDAPVEKVEKVENNMSTIQPGESKWDFIRRHLIEDDVDMTRVFANNPVANNFLVECFEVACELGHIKTVSNMIQCKALCNNIGEEHLYYASCGGNFEIINMVTDACRKSYSINYETKKNKWESRKISKKTMKKMKEMKKKLEEDYKHIDSCYTMYRGYNPGTPEHQIITKYIDEIKSKYFKLQKEYQYLNYKFGYSGQFGMMTPSEFERLMGLYCARGACNNGHFNVFKWYVDANPEVCDIKFMQDCWIYACKSGNIELVKYLMNRGVGGITKWNDGLYTASQYNKVEIIDLMIKKGADPTNTCPVDMQFKDGDKKTIMYCYSSKSVYRF